MFVNKLDRDGAAFAKAVREIGARLKGFPAVCQIPWWQGGKGKFIGVGDVVNLCGLKWTSEDGKAIEKYTLDKLFQEDEGLRSSLIKAREALVNALCSYDEQLLEVWMECNDDCLAVPADAIRASLRRCILDGSASIIPVFAGASFRNIGVQPLLDAVIDLLPNPSERPDAEIHLGRDKGGLKQLLEGKMSVTTTSSNRQIAKKAPVQRSLVKQIDGCALAFKVVNDARRGVLVYIRVYSGSIERNANLWNTNLQVTERVQRLLRMHASDAVEIPSIAAGQIGVIAGSRHARTGDTLIMYRGLNAKNGPSAPLHNLQLRPIDVPPPVFFAAVAPNSLSERKDVEEKLALLLREDPSLHIQVNEETGQTLLSGMGELHLEIARDRLVNDFKAKATMGDIEISYRECVLAPTTMQKVMFDRELQGKKGKAGCKAMVEPLAERTPNPKEQPILQDGNAITVRLDGSPEPNTPRENSVAMAISNRAAHKALLNGALAGLARGPRRAFPVHSTHVVVEFDPVKDYFGEDTTPTIISTAARMAVQAALKAAHQSGDVGVLEPVMDVVISCNESSLGNVIHDLSSARGGHVLSLDDSSQSGLDDSNGSSINLKDIYAPPDPFAPYDSDSTKGPGQLHQVIARVPLKEMVGYLKHLRSMTAGRGTFLMSVADWERVTGPREKAL